MNPAAERAKIKQARTLNIKPIIGMAAYKAKQAGSITDKEGNVIRFSKGQTIDVKKKDFEFDFDKHKGFEKAK